MVIVDSNFMQLMEDVAKESDKLADLWNNEVEYVQKRTGDNFHLAQKIGVAIGVSFKFSQMMKTDELRDSLSHEVPANFMKQITSMITEFGNSIREYNDVKGDIDPEVVDIINGIIQGFEIMMKKLSKAVS